MTREELLVERITYITKIALGEELNNMLGIEVDKDFNKAIMQASIKAAKVGMKFADSHPHWISVEDELPPMHCHLQDLGESTYGRGKIFCDSLPVVTHRVDGCIDMHCLMFNGEKNEFVWGGWNGSLGEPFDGSMITHWMPLPQAPKEGGEK